jgi:hypothetical protein
MILTQIVTKRHVNFSAEPCMDWAHMVLYFVYSSHVKIVLGCWLKLVPLRTPLTQSWTLCGGHGTQVRRLVVLQHTANPSLLHYLQNICTLWFVFSWSLLCYKLLQVLLLHRQPCGLTTCVAGHAVTVWTAQTERWVSPHTQYGRQRS